MANTPVLTKTEKINCRAYDTLLVEIQHFIRTRYLNSEASPKCSEELIKVILEEIIQKALDSFFRSYLNE